MNDTYAFLDALGLDETADARAIRRAYARQLKQVDQALDPAGFQALREAYETALDWAAYQAAEQAAEAAESVATAATAETGGTTGPAAVAVMPAPEAVPPAGAEPSGVDAQMAAPAVAPEREPGEEALAGAVIDRLGATAALLGEAGRLHDPNAWLDALLVRLRDEELVHLGARMRFEGFIVHVLGNGWQPGNEALFVAAVDAFGWEIDRRRLAHFGYLGNLLNQAIDEQALFAGQPEEIRTAQERIARQLRQAEIPDAAVLLRDVPELEAMSERFPALLQVSVSTEQVDRWRAAYRDLPAVRAGMGVDASALEPRQGGFDMWKSILLSAVLFSLLRYAYNHFDQPDPVPYSAPAFGQRLQGPPPAPDIVPTHAMMATLVPPIDYTPSRTAAPGKYAVEYQVLVDAEGTVFATNLRKSSGDPGFDKAVSTALLAAKPFPPNAARVFTMTFSSTFERRARPRPERSPAGSRTPVPAPVEKPVEKPAENPVDTPPPESQ